MATLTIRNVDENVKQKLRQMAARQGHSMEEEVRQILNRTVYQEAEKGLGTRIAAIFAELNGVELDIPPRSLARPAPTFLE